MPRNFTDKSLWNVANIALNNVNVSTIGEINALLAASGVPVNYGSQDDLGKRIIIADSEISKYTYTPNGTLFGGIFQVVYVDPGATAADVAAGRIAFTKDKTPSTGPADSGAQVYAVSDYTHADAVSLIAGVFLNSITPGNYGVIQVHGKVNLAFSATAPGATGVGSFVLPDTTTGDGKVTTLATAATVSVADVQLYLGDNIAIAAASTTVACQLKRLFGRY